MRISHFYQIAIVKSFYLDLTEFWGRKNGALGET